MTSPTPPPAGPAPPADEATRARVLVIDDEAETGRVIGRMLQAYNVVFAQSANGALGRIVAGGRFGAIVCDFRMPGMNGIQFYEEVTRVAPAMARRIVYVTGSAGTPDFVEFIDRSGCSFLEKPFDATRLRQVVSALVVAALDG